MAKRKGGKKKEKKKKKKKKVELSCFLVLTVNEEERKRQKKERKVENDRWGRAIKSNLRGIVGPSTLFFYNFAIELSFQSLENISNVFSVFITITQNF